MPVDGASGAERPAQTAERVVGAWRLIAESTQRCDRRAAERAVRRAYVAVGLPEPGVLVWMDSPLGGLVADLALRYRLADRSTEEGELLRRLLAEFSARLRERPAGVAARIRADCLGGLRAAEPRLRVAAATAGERVSLLPRGDERSELARRTGLSKSPEASRALRALRFWDAQVSRRLGRQMRGPLERLLAQEDRGQLFDQVVAGFSTWTVAHVLVGSQLARDRIGTPVPAATAALGDAVAALGWWWPLHGASVLVDRPTALHLDRDQRLHRADGPAVTWADGWTTSSWHGTTVPDDLVAGAGWDLGRILTEPNAEVRRCAIERMGWARFVTAAGMAQVGADHPDPGNPGKVLRLYDLPERLRDLYPQPARVLLVVNASPDRDGTRRAFGLPVPADVPDALSAAAATFGVSAAEYASLDRAT
ncbi:DUF6745 domain-containing protein [Pseudonocardia humida]|uniref:DUF6745 domain-containing protein n=1 Tax=Pseudonocardia humida TaxID=2800819 RepID=A0ABT0ZU37_9PSEU|nr:hypothetical protein [Pseudonocardia humida]MCO1654252.1 hypothetical protein [Pseudonocardia humida]